MPVFCFYSIFFESADLKQHPFDLTLEELCNPKHPLVILSRLADWKSFDTFSSSLSRRDEACPVDVTIIFFIGVE